jgi:hypothetical protein
MTYRDERDETIERLRAEVDSLKERLTAKTQPPAGVTIVKPAMAKFRLSCPTCGCTFEYEIGYIQTRPHSLEKVVKCPSLSCGYLMTHRVFRAEG